MITCITARATTVEGRGTDLRYCTFENVDFRKLVGAFGEGIILPYVHEVLLR